ncbi:MAG: hypothetical protein IT252_03155 [Chitinophagaceae bacterium]|nr:hypothetical protein [Chitinophagaceae bacterium]
MYTPISITLGSIIYGWLPVDFRYKDFHLDFEASDVLNDPVDELQLVATTLQHNETQRVTFWLEAPAYFFDFKKLDDNYRLTILYTDDLNDKSIVPEILHSIEGNENEIIMPLRKALSEYESLR